MDSIALLYPDIKKNPSVIELFQSSETDVLSLVSWSAIIASGSVFWHANVRVSVGVDYNTKIWQCCLGEVMCIM